MMLPQNFVAVLATTKWLIICLSSPLEVRMALRQDLRLQVKMRMILMVTTWKSALSMFRTKALIWLTSAQQSSTKHSQKIGISHVGYNKPFFTTALMG